MLNLQTVLVLAGVVGAYLFILWLVKHSENKAVEANTLKMQGDINEQAAKQSKGSAETFSKPDIDDPNQLADSFNSLPK